MQKKQRISETHLMTHHETYRWRAAGALRSILMKVKNDRTKKKQFLGVGIILPPSTGVTTRNHSAYGPPESFVASARDRLSRRGCDRQQSTRVMKTWNFPQGQSTSRGPVITSVRPVKSTWAFDFCSCAHGPSVRRLEPYYG